MVVGVLREVSTIYILCQVFCMRLVLARLQGTDPVWEMGVSHMGCLELVRWAPECGDSKGCDCQVQTRWNIFWVDQCHPLFLNTYTPSIEV